MSRDARRLVRMWKASGLTQQQLANAVGARRVGVARWGAGLTRPRLCHYMAVVRFFKQHLDALRRAIVEDDA